MKNNNIHQAVDLIKQSKYTTTFTGAGISVESGIPPFRGDDGLWAQYDPIILDLNYYLQNANESWPKIKKLFFDFFGTAKPNYAHFALAEMEQQGFLNNIITQNIDNLHQKAGSKKVYEFHGNSIQFVCTKCNAVHKRSNIQLTDNPPLCISDGCNGLLKPDFIFFGEGIPQQAYERSINAANNADVFLIIGTTGEIMPASQIPYLAKQNGAKIIEINIEESNFTSEITDVFIKQKASITMKAFVEGIM